MGRRCIYTEKVTTITYPAVYLDLLGRVGGGRYAAAPDRVEEGADVTGVS